MPERWDVVVVGAGISGLAAAFDLARRGQKVLTLETEHVGAGNAMKFGPVIGDRLARTALARDGVHPDLHARRQAQLMRNGTEREPPGVASVNV
jgi:glycine/D-amino acid oxidase-like deaminating enzyme